MISRRDFIIRSTTAVAATTIPSWNILAGTIKTSSIGIQLYTMRKEMMADAKGTLKTIASLGFKEIESAGSEKGNYYGLSAKEIKTICSDLGLVIRSGHVHLDDKWDKTLDEASETGQEYVICSSMPTSGQTVSNYKTVADSFSKTGEACKKRNLKFGYHNHDYEFDADNGKVLYDVLLENTDASNVHMELDLGWVVAAGKNPIDYFNRFPGRFPLWHLKDMDPKKKESTEFGKGNVNIAEILKNAGKSGMKHFFVEQEEYAVSPVESMKIDLAYLKKIMK